MRAYAGLDPVTGPGVTISVSGPIDGPALEALANELRNAGAEAIAVAGVRLVPGVVMTGAAGDVKVDGVPVDASFDIDAIGASEQLTGSLTRSGGIIAQLAATQEDGRPDRHADGAARPAGDRSSPRAGQRPPSALIR